MFYQAGFQLSNLVFSLVFLIVIVTMAVMLVKSLLTWNKNNHSPRLTVQASVVSKRASVSHHHHGGDMPHHTTSTSYYATFEVESGDRMELRLSGSEYGLLAEGDQGKLTFQGTRYLGFVRT